MELADALAEGRWIDDAAGAGPQRTRLQFERHEGRPGEWRREGLGEFCREAEARIVVAMTEHEDGLPVL